MLYDPKWEQQTKQRPTVAGMIAWLEVQPPAESYEWIDCKGGCAVDRYLGSIGCQDDWTHEERSPLEDIALEHPWTFGAALERARKLAAA